MNGYFVRPAQGRSIPPGLGPDRTSMQDFDPSAAATAQEDLATQMRSRFVFASWAESEGDLAGSWGRFNEKAVEFAAGGIYRAPCGSVPRGNTVTIARYAGVFGKD